MKNVIINGKISTVDAAIEYLTIDGEIDLDTLGYCMTDQNAFNLALNDLSDRAFTPNELIARYLEIASENLIID